MIFKVLYETTKLNTVVLAKASGINHGITFGGGYLYPRELYWDSWCESVGVEMSMILRRVS